MNITIGYTDLLLISPMIVLFITSLVPITTKVLRGNIEAHPAINLSLALIGILTAIVLLIIPAGAGTPAFNNSLVFDGITLWMGVIGLASAGISMIMMYENPATSGKQFSELIFLALNSVVGMLILVSAVDLLMIFIGLELMSLSLYLMIAMSHEERVSKEAAIKYFVLGSFATAIFLYGVSFIYGSTGSVNILSFFENASELIKTSRLFLFGVTFVILGFCFKVSIAPFHAWTPDVYQGAPTPHAAFMATAVKAVSFAAFLRIISTKALLGSDQLFDILQWFAVITMIVGNTAAIIQNNFKRMIAYSSIAHSGYLLVGVITAGVSENGAFGASGVIFYLLSYALMTLGALAIVGSLEKSENSVVNIDDLAGLAKSRPLMALCLTTFLLSLAGIPPTLGFFGKFYLFNAAIGEGLMWLAIWGVLNSVIAVYYYLRPIVVMYMKEGQYDHGHGSLSVTAVATIFIALAILFMGLVSGPIFTAVEHSLLKV
jgi:NADH-quinone oxidoreductase subunit N